MPRRKNGIGRIPVERARGNTTGNGEQEAKKAKHEKSAQQQQRHAVEEGIIATANNKWKQL